MDTAVGTETPCPQPAWWRLGLWWIASVSVALAHNGLWATPNLGFMAHIARNPGTNPFPESLPGDYLLSGLSMPSLAVALGQTDPHQVARLHLIVLVVTWAGVVALARHRYDFFAARNLTVLLAAAPVVTVSMQWLGQPDPVTAMCGIAMVLVRRRWAVFAFAALAGLTHPEQALFMAPIAGVVRLLLPDTAVASDSMPTDAPARSTTTDAAAILVVAVGGVMAGRFATQVWFWITDITINVPRSAYIDSGMAVFWRHHTQEPVALLWSLWGPLWLVVVGVGVMAAMPGVARRWGTDAPPGAQRALWGFAGLAAAALLPVFVTLDETRVYAVLTAPILAGAAIWLAYVLPARFASRAAVVLLALTAAIPAVMATGTASTRGDLDTPAMTRFLVHGTVPSQFQDPVEGPLMTEWLLGPFDIVLDDPGR